MKNNITVSVCIANFNGASIIDDCVESVLKQKIAMNIEIIIHDDASTDNSVNLITQKYPHIQLIVSHENVGFCVANNRMAACAHGEYILFLNNDAELFPDAIDTLFAAAQSTNKATIFGLPQYAADTHALIDRGAFLDPFFNVIPNKAMLPSEVAMVAGACLWIPKNLWEELGGFPSWFESIAEDLCLCCRARLLSHPVMALSTSGYYHRVGNSFGGGKIDHGQLVTTFKRRALSERNRLFTMLIVVPDLWLYLFLPLQVILLLIEGAILTVVKRQPHIWMDIYAPLLPSIFRYRKQWMALRHSTQQKKCISFKYWLCAMQWQPYKLQMFIKYGIPDIR